MAGPTWAECATQLKNAIKPFTDLEAQLSTFVTDIDNAEQDLEGDFLPGAITGILSGFRDRLSRAVDWGQARAVWDAWILETLRVAGLPTDDAYARIARYMHEQSFTFNDRNWTRGTPSAGGGNVGTGTLVRLTVDWEAYNLQAGHVETKRFECDVDQNLGAFKGGESFVATGEDATKDNLEYQGSGLALRPIYVKHAGTGNGGSQLLNASLDATLGSTSTAADKVPGWTIGGTPANVTADTTNYHTIAPGSSSGQSLAFAAAAGVTEITQALSVRRLSAIGERVPWMLQVAYRKSSAGATGTLNIKMGNKTTALDLSTIGDTNWRIHQFTINKNVYYRNWVEDSPDIEVEVDTLSAGFLNIDNVIFAPWDFIDGTYWWLSGGGTAFLNRDYFTAADSGPTAATSELMYSAFRAGVPINFPTNNAGGESVTDP